MTKHAALKQRADYTYRQNVQAGRHGWLRLTPAYSLKLVEEIILGSPRGARVLDPFSGTGTTALCAASNGHKACGIELNPFLVWFAQAKTAHYEIGEIIHAREIAETITKSVCSGDGALSESPSLHNINRWWNAPELEFLRKLMGAIQSLHGIDRKIRDLVLIAFCRVMIQLSNAAFNHQSMSFKCNKDSHVQLALPQIDDFLVKFLDEFNFVLLGARDNPIATAAIRQGDSRCPEKYAPGEFDLLITSPPYPNRISYVRELRPYMYWLGYLSQASQAGELDWQAVGGTWGSATSKLMVWHRAASGFYPKYFVRLLDGIERAGEKSGQLLSRYVARYFEDMWMHLTNVQTIISPGASVHYVVGNTSFYGVLVPVERLYADMLTELGFRDVEVRVLRKRNSKKELIEFDVCAKKA